MKSNKNKQIKKWLIIFCLIGVYGYSQKIIEKDSLTRMATINHSVNGNEVTLIPETPPLQQIAGAPKAFYTYYWEFGDGTYSKENNPRHRYKKKGDYVVRLWATNNYDTGKPPTTRPKKISVDGNASTDNDTAAMTNDFTLQRNREPMPEEEIVVILSYRNSKDFTTNGKLFLFYNEDKYRADNFELTETRIHHNEKEVLDNAYTFSNDVEHFKSSFLASANENYQNLVQEIQDSTQKTNLPLTLENAKNDYRDKKVLEFNNMEPNEERNVFFTLRTTPEMLKDTSAIISVRGIYVPDSNYDNHNVKDMEMEIVTSHDPNKMSSNGSFMNYRLVRFKTLKYKIKFQNNGEGPARTIRLETDIPEMLDKSTLEIMDMYPKCRICPKKKVTYSCLDTTYTDKQAIFTFKNIYLPGSEQKNVMEYDSTKGFVKYKIKFAKDFHKKKTKSRTAIIFDKNEPIITNYATTRFVPGISIGAKAGYNFFDGLDNSKSYFAGITLSPYKSYRWYLQGEFLTNLHTFNTSTKISETILENPNQRQLQRSITYASYENIDWEVPVLMRYNVNNYIGLGTGVQGIISLSEKQQMNTTTELYENETDDFLINTETETTKEEASFTNFRTAFLLDFTVGFARIGPSLGVRYILNSQKDHNYFQLYAIWKF